MKHRFHPQAQEELSAAIRYYESCRAGLGGKSLDEVDAGIAKVEDAPGRWAEIKPGIRRYGIDRFPYGLIYYLAEGGWVEILAVMDLRRRPDYWIGRIGR